MPPTLVGGPTPSLGRRAVPPVQPHPGADDPDPRRVPGAGSTTPPGSRCPGTTRWPGRSMVTPVGFLGLSRRWVHGRGGDRGMADAGDASPPLPNPPPRGGRGPDFGFRESPADSKDGRSPSLLPRGGGSGRGGGQLSIKASDPRSLRRPRRPPLGDAPGPPRRYPRTPGHDGVRLFLPAFGMLWRSSRAWGLRRSSPGLVGSPARD